jgi:1-acyl-sn-glycerol-3-phosphate acyltransferase
MVVVRRGHRIVIPPYDGAVRRVADGVMGTLARLLVHIFFRRVEVEHGEAIALGVPTVLVANHTNGLVDGLLPMAALRRYPRFLGKSTPFKILPVWPFLKLAGVVPVYRSKDGESTSKNTGPSPCVAVCWPTAAWWRCSPRASTTTRPVSNP